MLVRAAPIPAVVAAAVLPAGCGPRDKLIMVNDQDAKVNAAIAEARATLPMFWEKYDGQAPGVTHYEVKAQMPTPHGGFEHIWIDVESHSKLAVRGTLANDPVELKGVKFGSVVTFEPEKISDWLYERDGRIYGGYTIRALSERMTPEERRQAERQLSSTPLEASVH
ncbi:MAG: YegJ family protein [Caulobacterales bacterium]|jgi:uncharacterized protein YegJ (DUF2314 family)